MDMAYGHMLGSSHRGFIRVICADGHFRVSLPLPAPVLCGHHRCISHQFWFFSLFSPPHCSCLTIRHHFSSFCCTAAFYLFGIGLRTRTPLVRLVATRHVRTHDWRSRCHATPFFAFHYGYTTQFTGYSRTRLNFAVRTGSRFVLPPRVSTTFLAFACTHLCRTHGHTPHSFTAFTGNSLRFAPSCGSFTWDTLMDTSYQFGSFTFSATVCG